MASSWDLLDEKGEADLHKTRLLNVEEKPFKRITKRLNTLSSIALPATSQIVRTSVAADWMLTGRAVSAVEADRRGLVSELVDADRLMDRAGELARLIGGLALVIVAFALVFLFAR